MAEINLDDLAAEPRRRSQREWSEFQEAIFSAGENSNANLSCRAVAGSGKTTTLEELTYRLKGDTLAVAFNKSTATTLASRVNAVAFTFNSIGHRILSRRRPGSKLNQWKVHDAVREAIGSERYEVMGSQLVRAISVAKAEALGIEEPLTREQMSEIIDSYGLEIPADHLPWAAAVAEKLFNENYKDTMSFDFDDQLYIPIREGWNFPSFDNILVDEDQDLNPVQHRMLMRMHERSGRIIGFGDPAQAIYGFRGALANSVDVLEATFSMAQMPLSISYRCPRSVVELAQQLVPVIQPAPNAADGSVEYLTEYPDLSAYKDSLIVCRNNGPIFDLALKFIRANEPVRVQSNLLESMEKFLKSFKTDNIKVLRQKLESYFQEEIELAKLRGFMGRVEGLEDRRGVLMPFLESMSSTAEILLAFKRLSQCPVGPIISTVHRAKGMENKKVFILRPDLMPSKQAMSEEQKRQENNLRYVAITRALDQLIFLPSEEQ